jgi:hypothetical protein
MGTDAPACPEVEPVIVPHIGDTQEIFILDRETDGGRGRGPKRRWSPVRSRAAVVALLVSFAFVVEVIMRPHHGLDQLPQIALDVVRANWVIALLCVLAAWAYDTIAPKLWQRLAVLRHGLRELGRVEERILEVQRAHADEISALRGRQETAIVEAQRENRSVVLKIDRLAAGLGALADKLGDHDVDTYIEGFNNGLVRTVDIVPGQAVSSESDRTVVPFPTPVSRKGLSVPAPRE